MSKEENTKDLQVTDNSSLQEKEKAKEIDAIIEKYRKELEQAGAFDLYPEEEPEYSILKDEEEPPYKALTDAKGPTPKAGEQIRQLQEARIKEHQEATLKQITQAHTGARNDLDKGIFLNPIDKCHDYFIEGFINDLSDFKALTVTPINNNFIDNEFIAKELKENDVTRPLLLITDSINNDKGKKKIINDFKRYDLKVTPVTLIDEEAGVNDLREYANKCPDKLKEALNREGRPKTTFNNRTVKKDKELILDNLYNGAPRDGLKTGFPLFDSEEYLNGLHPEDSFYLLGAKPGTGKTAFALSIATNLCKLNNEKVLYLALEDSKRQIHNRNISRYTAEPIGFTWNYKNINKKYAKNVKQINNPTYFRRLVKDEKEHILNSINRYFNDVGDKLEVIESSVGAFSVDYMEEIVKEYIQFTGKPPVIFLDYLQLLKPSSEDAQRYNATDKQHIDSIINSVKGIAMKYNAIIFAISSFNRTSFDGKGGMSSYLGSGNLEYTAGVAMVLKEEEGATEAQGKKNIELEIVKNRNGQSNISLYYDYVPEYHIFIEKDEEYTKKKNKDYNKKPYKNNNSKSKMIQAKDKERAEVLKRQEEAMKRMMNN